jgi:hypothetical protein
MKEGLQLQDIGSQGSFNGRCCGFGACFIIVLFRPVNPAPCEYLFVLIGPRPAYESKSLKQMFLTSIFELEKQIKLRKIFFFEQYQNDLS